MNIANILKNCPKGTELYCTIFGQVELKCVVIGTTYPIQIRTIDQKVYGLTDDGKWNFVGDTECVLFPSKENRDWDAFRREVEGNICGFKPFDKVIVRQTEEETWHIDIFECYMSDIPESPYTCMVGAWKYCVPFSEETAKLIGTKVNYEG